MKNEIDIRVITCQLRILGEMVHWLYEKNNNEG